MTTLPRPNNTQFMDTPGAVSTEVLDAYADLIEASEAAIAALQTAQTLVARNVQTASYTAVLADAGKAIEMNVAGANNLTIPPNVFPVDTVLEGCQVGAGQTTVVAGAGVTLRSPGGKLKFSGQWSSVSARQRTTNEWVLAGDLTA